VTPGFAWSKAVVDLPMYVQPLAAIPDVRKTAGPSMNSVIGSSSAAPAEDSAAFCILAGRSAGSPPRAALS